MRFGDWTPYPESRMGMVFPRYTICEVLRQIYRKIEDPEVRLKIRIAMAMGKSMDAKLREGSPCRVCNKRWPDKTKEVNQEVQQYLEQH